METRQITVIDSETQSKHVINTNATTFGELKELVRQAGVNVDGKDWLEGFTKTSPRDDSSILPTNVNYKGKITNSLVYMISNTNKKTNSGMSRKEIYSKIKELDLADTILDKFHESYTRLKSNVLEDFISNFGNKKNNLENKEDDAKEDISDNVAKAIAEMCINLGIAEEVSKLIVFLTPVNLGLSDDELDDLFD